MVKCEKGKITLTEKEYNSLKQQNIDGKIVYILETKERKKVEIDKQEFEQFLRPETKRIDVLLKFDVSSHYLQKFIKKNYDCSCFNILKNDLLKSWK